MYGLLEDVRDHRPQAVLDKVTPIMGKAVPFFKGKSGVAVGRASGIASVRESDHGMLARRT